MTRAVRITGGAGYDPALLNETVEAALVGTGWALMEGDADLVIDVDALVPTGLDTLAFPVRAALIEHEHPGRIVHYGDDPEQWISWREPVGEARGVAVLVHGGFYRSRWRADLMTALAVDLAERGWLAANLEYRRPDRHGWDTTVADILEGVAVASRERTDLPIVLFGHSAGGQLVLQAIETLEPGTVDLAVSLTGVVDLAAACQRGMGEHAIQLALGGTPAQQPERYAAADPTAWTSRHGEWLLVECHDDSTDLREMNRRLASRDDLDRPELIEGPGNHFSVVDPAADVWHATIERVEEIVRAL